MSVSVLNSASLAGGGTFTPGAGTANRMMLAFAFSANNPPVTLTNIIYNGVTRTPAVTNSWGTSVLAMGVCIFLNSELSGSALSVTPTWSTAPSQSQVVCVTLDGATQSLTPAGSAGPYQSTDTNASSQGITGIATGNFVAGMGLNRGGLTVADTTAGWASLQSALIPAGSVVYDVSWHTAGGTTDTYALSYTGTTDMILSLIAIAAAAGGGSFGDMLPLLGAG